MRDFSDAQVERYARHIILPQVGGEGQSKLLDANVLILGAGGLGSPVAAYLAAAGVGTLGIADFDMVDVSNLQRQIIHGTSDVGRPKVESAVDAVRELNPDVAVVPITERIDSSNALRIFGEYDVIVDGTDNFPTRYLANDACRMTGKPLVHGSIFQFEGQAIVFDPRQEGTPCYRCLFPHPPPPGAVPNCAQAGVFGVLAGVIGVVQATEALKLILGVGESLVGRLLLYDALTMEFTRVRVNWDPSCPLCGTDPEIDSLIDYEQFCGVNA